MKKLFAALLLCSSMAFGQGTPPGTSIIAPIGITGSFSLTGSIPLTGMTDANYTLGPNEWWAGQLIIPSSVTLTAARTITAPGNSTNNAGQFYNSICNHSTGGFTVNFKAAEQATPIPIANGDACVSVSFDAFTGNYVQVGSSGGGGCAQGTCVVNSPTNGANQTVAGPLTATCQLTNPNDICLTAPPYYASPNGATTTTTSGTFGVGTSGSIASCSTLAANNGVLITGAGAAGANYIGKVVSCSGTTLTVTPATSTSVGSGVVVQHDETTAINTALGTFSTTSGSIFLPCPLALSVYLVNGPLLDTGGANAVLTVPSIPNYTANYPNIRLTGCAPSDNGQYSNSQIVTSVNTGNLIGGYNATTGGGFPPFTSVNLTIENLTIVGPGNPGSVLINATNIEALTVKNLLVRSATAAVPSNTAGGGIFFPAITNSYQNVLNNVTLAGFWTNVKLTEHTRADQLYTQSGVNCAMFDNGSNVGAPGTYLGNSVSVGYMWTLGCTHAVAAGSNSTAINIQSLDSELSTADIYDPSNLLHGYIGFQNPYSPNTLNMNGGSNLTIFNMWTNEFTSLRTNSLETNGWGIVPPGQLFYAEGSSIIYGNLLATAVLPEGGLTGNYFNLLTTSVWGKDNTGTYNDGVPGSTSPQSLARYTTGNSCCGVTVPSAHSLSPAVTGSQNRALYFLDTCTTYNDAHNSVNTATSISSLTSLTTAARADGYFVVALTCNITDQYFATATAQMLAVNQAVRTGSIPSDLVADAAFWLPNVFDSTYYNLTSGGASHPNANGHRVIAANLLAGMISGGFPVNYSGGYSATSQTFANGLTVYGSSPLTAPTIMTDTEGDVSIGTSTPLTPVNVNDAGFLQVQGVSQGTILATSGTATTDGSLVGAYGIADITNTTDADTALVQILGYLDGSTSGRRGGKFSIWTRPDNSPTLTDRFDIDNAGTVSVGAGSTEIKSDGNIITQQGLQTAISGTTGAGVATYAESDPNAFFLFGQKTTSNPKQLLVSSTYASNIFYLQAVQQGSGFNQTIALNPSGGKVTAPTVAISNNDTEVATTAAVTSGFSSFTANLLNSSNIWTGAENTFNKVQALEGVFANQIIAQGSTPTMTPGAAAGTSPTCTTITGANMAGVITCTTGTATTVGTLATITFAGGPLATAPQTCNLQAKNGNAAAANVALFTTSESTTGWTIDVSGVPLTISVPYIIGYHCI